VKSYLGQRSELWIQVRIRSSLYYVRNIGQQYHDGQSASDFPEQVSISTLDHPSTVLWILGRSWPCYWLQSNNRTIIDLPCGCLRYHGSLQRDTFPYTSPSRLPMSMSSTATSLQRWPWLLLQCHLLRVSSIEGLSTDISKLRIVHMYSNVAQASFNYMMKGVNNLWTH
jgi:hypothetical protein